MGNQHHIICIQEHEQSCTQEVWYTPLPLRANCPLDVLLQHLNEQTKEGRAEWVTLPYPNHHLDKVCVLAVDVHITDTADCAYRDCMQASTLPVML
jgi:hypothetical protein